MFAKYENRLIKTEKVWCGKWLSLKNNAHWHDESELVYCESGKTNVFIENQTIILNQGECVFLESGLIHKIIAEEGSICITLIMHKSVITEIIGTQKLENNKLEHNYNILKFYNDIKRLRQEKSVFYAHKVNALTVLLLTDIFEKEKTTQATNTLKNGRYSLLKEILETVEQNYNFITFKEVCSKFGYSPAHFSRLFVKFTGTTFTKYLTSIKISNAVNLLQSDKNVSITEIATSCGFSSLRNFNRYFKQYTGFSPRKLPQNYTFPIESFKLYNNPLDPTANTSVLLD